VDNSLAIQTSLPDVPAKKDEITVSSNTTGSSGSDKKEANVGGKDGQSKYKAKKQYKQRKKKEAAGQATGKKQKDALKLALENQKLHNKILTRQTIIFCTDKIMPFRDRWSAMKQKTNDKNNHGGKAKSTKAGKKANGKKGKQNHVKKSEKPKSRDQYLPMCQQIKDKLVEWIGDKGLYPDLRPETIKKEKIEEKVNRVLKLLRRIPAEEYERVVVESKEVRIRIVVHDESTKLWSLIRRQDVSRYFWGFRIKMGGKEKVKPKFKEGEVVEGDAPDKENADMDEFGETGEVDGSTAEEKSSNTNTNTKSKNADSKNPPDSDSDYDSEFEDLCSDDEDADSQGEFCGGDEEETED
jgi:hypothetical protein